jgi:hypothetical protein
MGKKNAKFKAAKAKAEKAKAAEAVARKAEGGEAEAPEVKAGPKTEYAGAAWIRSVTAELKTFRNELAYIQWKPELILDDDDDWREPIFQFSELSFLRGVPGIPPGMGEGKIFASAGESDKNTLRVYLRGFGIRDLESFWKAIRAVFKSHRDYNAFRSIREKSPVRFDPNTLSYDERRIFYNRMALDEQLREICGKVGFVAWDVGESIDLCRRAYSAGFISRKSVWETSCLQAKSAAHYFDDWGEYALSYASGAIYYLYHRMLHKELSQTFASSYIKKHFRLLRNLTAPGGLWRTSFWPKYREGGKKCFIPVRDMNQLIPEYHEACKVVGFHLHPGFVGKMIGARATDRIMVDGAKVGLMYRESPRFDRDSGWRFAAGDESYDYKRKPKYFSIFDLNTISNYDPDIIEFLNLETGSVLRRIDGGPLRPVDG